MAVMLMVDVMMMVMKNDDGDYPNVKSNRCL